MKRADRLGARWVAILGEDELSRGVWTLRDMASSAQEAVAESGVVDRLKERILG
jgi:histidyl-tRNA synthetase